MNSDTQVHDHFHTVEVIAEQSGPGRAVALVAAVSIAAAATAAWRSPLGRKARNKIANAIKAE